MEDAALQEKLQEQIRANALLRARVLALEDKLQRIEIMLRQGMQPEVEQFTAVFSNLLKLL